MNKNNIKKALDRVQQQIAIIPNNPAIYILQAGIYETNKDLTNAEISLKKAVSLSPDLPMLHNTLANFYLRQHALDKAKKEYTAAQAKDANDLNAHMAMGMIYENEKNFAKAQEYYEKALKINPNFAPAANNLAYLYAERGGNIDVALNLAQKAKEKIPDDPNISDTLGWIYYKKNIHSRAISYLREASEKLPNQAIIHYHLGMAYYKNGNRDLAKNELTLALKMGGFSGIDDARSILKELK
jgi:tetratricopeptide (TPR) repeat protein